MKSITVMIPGSFDPPTNGHIDLITRASVLFDKVVVVVATNNSKNALFTQEERTELLKKCLNSVPNVQVDSTQDLVANYAKEKNISTIVRGVRNSADYSYEAELSLTNKLLNNNLETIFIPAGEKYRVLRSSGVRELAHFGADISLFVPKVVSEALNKKRV